LLRLGIVPGGVLVALPVDKDIVVAGHALPRARRVMAALAEELLAQRLRREVMVALDHNGLVAFGQHGVIPDGLLRVASSSVKDSAPRQDRSACSWARCCSFTSRCRRIASTAPASSWRRTASRMRP